jgi:putative ABC transport system permease protein
MAWTHEISVAVRGLRRSGSLALVVVLMLAVAIGAVTSVYSIARAVLLRPLPIVDPDRVLLLWGHDDARSQAVVEVSLGDLRVWRAGQRSFAAIEVFGSVNWGELRITGPGEPFGVTQNAVSAGFFDVFGTQPLLGRTFRPGDDLPNAPRTVVLSGDLWQRRFGSDPAVIGTALTVGEGRDATPFEIIGVMPPAFRIPSGAEVWITIGPVLAQAAEAQGWLPGGVRAMYAVGRLAPGASRQEAVAELSTIARNEEITHGIADSAMVVVATPVLEHLLGPARPALLAIGGAAAMLLLVGCANAAGLLLVHAASRRREVAVCLALGARRWHIARQRLCESLLLSLAAGMLGVGLAYVSFDAMVGLVPIEVPRLDEAAIDGRTLLFALAVSMSTALAVTLLPAWQHSGADLTRGLQDRSERGTTAPASTRIRKALVAAQIAAAVVLLTGAGLFARSFVALLRLDLGFNPRNVVTFHLGVPDSRYDTREKRWALVDAVIERAMQVPDVRAVGAIYLRPFEHGPIGMDSNVVLEGQPLTAEASSRNPILNWEAVTPDYFRAMDIRLLQGRLFTDLDTEQAPPVVIVSEALAARLWPGQDAIGRRIIAYGAPGDEQEPGWQTVVGVVESARYREIDTPRFDLYLPYRQAPNDVQHFVVRVAGDPLGIVPQLRTAVAAFDPDVRIDGISTMSRIVGRVLAPWRFSTVVVSAFSILALVFAAIGLAALIAYAVTQRTREIGVRMALGAQPRDVVSLFLREGTVMTLTGLGIGVLVAWNLKHTIERMLFGIAPDDAVTFGAVAVLLLGVALLAAYVPARRAARIDPATALRRD